jgi:predicted secreted hydrolase
MKFLLFAIYLTFSIISAYSQSWKTYPYEPEGSLVTFPADEGRHEQESIEWWYTSGYLTGEVTGTLYSYMVSYFYYEAYGYDGFRIFNLSNEISGQFYSDVQPLIYSELALDRLTIQATISPERTESWTNKTDENENMIPFEYVLSVSSSDIALDLEYEALKPPLIVGDSGYFKLGFSNYTYYYSLTKNAVSGSIVIDGMMEPVSGFSWIDRQYGTFNPLTAENYEWFSLQLSNEMDINLWNLFTARNEIPTTPAYRFMSVYVDNNTQYTTDQFEIERLSFQYMPDSARCYSQKWRLTSQENGLDLVITTRHNNSEVQLPFRFFEGSTVITGTVNGVPVTGTGFAELLHSYSKPDISITYPQDDFWNSISPISWQLINPDDGRPIKYDLECSADNKITYFTVAAGLSDTLYYWDNPALTEGDSCWFKVTAYSVDTTLQHTEISASPSVYNPNLTSLITSEEVSFDNRILKLYPNPVTETLFIELSEKQSYQYLQVTDIYGNIMMGFNIGKQNQIYLDLINISPGIYFVRLFSGEKTISSKFIVK